MHELENLTDELTCETETNRGIVGPRGPQGEDGAQGVSVTGVELLSTVGIDKTYRMHFSNNTYFDYVVKDGSEGETVNWGGINGQLSNQTDLQNALNSKQDNLTEGAHIDITGNTISVEGMPTKTSDLLNDSLFITKSVDNLDNYTTTSDMNTALNGKQNTLVPGAGISITANSTVVLKNASADEVGGVKLEYNSTTQTLNIKNI
jgi:hypothetical protein